MLLKTGQVINLLHVITIDPDDPKKHDVCVMMKGHPITFIIVDKEDAKQIRNAIIDITSRLMDNLLLKS